MRDVGAFQRIQATAKGVRDRWNYDMRNETKSIAAKSLEGAEREPKPLFSGQLRNLRWAYRFVRCNELWFFRELAGQ